MYINGGKMSIFRDSVPTTSVFSLKRILNSWKVKAFVTFLISCLPFSEKLYKSIQKKFGRLYPDPEFLLHSLRNSIDLLTSNGYVVKNKVVFEVGSGHELISPLGWFLHGAANVHSIDLNRRLDLEIFGKSLQIIRDYESNTLRKEYFEKADTASFESRIRLLAKHAEDPEGFISSAKINYLAPADAADAPLSDGSVDIHFSNTVFEHIPPDILFNILEEAKRILKPDGLLLHNIDLSDHFAHTDPRIQKINFLKFSKLVWNLLAGNRFAYCNRLRASEFRELFARAGLEILAEVVVVDLDAQSALKQNFLVNSAFKSFSNEDLCTTSITLLARVKNE